MADPRVPDDLGSKRPRDPGESPGKFARVQQIEEEHQLDRPTLVSELLTSSELEQLLRNKKEVSVYARSAFRRLKEQGHPKLRDLDR